MELQEENSSGTETKKTFIPEKYLWKKSYSLVLIANAFYIVFFYFLMRFFL